MNSRLHRELTAAVGTLALCCACSSGPPSAPTARVASDAGVAFEAVLPRVYVAKAKNILVGLAPTEAEVEAVTANSAALGPLVDTWMQRPEYAVKMRRFLELALEQTQINANDFADEVHGQLGLNDATTPLLLQNAEESFARTALEFDAEGRPFTAVISTNQVLMTTALKEFYAFLDTVEIDDDANTSDHYRATHLAEALLLRQLGAVRRERPGIFAHRLAVPRFEPFLQRVGESVRHFAAHHVRE